MVVGSIRPRSPGSPSRSNLGNASRRQRREPPPPRRREPRVIRCFDASSYSNKKIPSFTCTSGELLWGQLHTVIGASKSDQRDAAGGPTERGVSGTIRQSKFAYRAKARKGVWRVEPVFIDDWHVAYVCYHANFKGLDIVREAAKVGVSVANNHKNKNIVYVNRYDWGEYVGPGLQVVLDAIGCKRSEDEITDAYEDGIGWDSEDDELKAKEKGWYFMNWLMCRVMLVDPEGLPTLIQAMKEGEKLKDKNYLFHYPSGTSGQAGNEARKAPFGVNLVPKIREFDFGWMKFTKGELVGFVYDIAYSDLDLSRNGGRELKVGGIVARELGVPDEDSDWEEDPHFVHYRPSDTEDSELDIRIASREMSQNQLGRN
ncbi:hypothetical protein R1sor_019557 [Riccia sorocarpa]|uniref:Uncharacterized protein n=1 Tax=Riccia sorocarpa TaxID=122646 RepID=A0ABD3ICV0_9MARC